MKFINKYLGCRAKWGKARQKNETSCKSVESGPQKKLKVTDQFLLKLCGVESHEFHTAEREVY